MGKNISGKLGKLLRESGEGTWIFVNIPEGGHAKDCPVAGSEGIGLRYPKELEIRDRTFQTGFNDRNSLKIGMLKKYSRNNNAGWFLTHLSTSRLEPISQTHCGMLNLIQHLSFGP